MDIEIQTVLKNLREQIGQQAQEIAVLKATIETLQKEDDKVE
jgi:capsule polysaccharide export protein KpsE/RkpR